MASHSGTQAGNYFPGLDSCPLSEPIRGTQVWVGGCLGPSSWLSCLVAPCLCCSPLQGRDLNPNYASAHSPCAECLTWYLPTTWDVDARGGGSPPSALVFATHTHTALILQSQPLGHSQASLLGCCTCGSAQEAAVRGVTHSPLPPLGLFPHLDSLESYHTLTPFGQAASESTGLAQA